MFKWTGNMLLALAYENTWDGVSWEKEHDSSVPHFDQSLKRTFSMTREPVAVDPVKKIKAQS